MYGGFKESSLAAAVDYYSRIMTEDDTLSLKVLVKKLPKAPSTPRRYLQRNCQTVREMKEFFEENSDRFFTENNRVALYDEELLKAAEMTEQYFKGIVGKYEYPVPFTALKEKYLGKADDDIRNFVSRFYPVGEFRNFFKKRPDVYGLEGPQNVFLIERKSVDYFKKRLKTFGRTELHFLAFRGHIGQAPPQVQDYINKNYPGDEFQIFLMNNCHAFHLDECGFVSLKPSLKPLWRL